MRVRAPERTSGPTKNNPPAPPNPKPPTPPTPPHKHAMQPSPVAPSALRHLLVGTRGRSLLLLTPAALAAPPTATTPSATRRVLITMAASHSGSGRTLYCSTRGGVKDATFEDVVLGGLAPDRGLYVPQQGIPAIPAKELEEVRALCCVRVLCVALVGRIGWVHVTTTREDARCMYVASTNTYTPTNPTHPDLSPSHTRPSTPHPQNQTRCGRSPSRRWPSPSCRATCPRRTFPTRTSRPSSTAPTPPSGPPVRRASPFLGGGLFLFVWETPGPSCVSLGFWFVSCYQVWWMVDGMCHGPAASMFIRPSLRPSGQYSV